MSNSALWILMSLMSDCCEVINGTLQVLCHMAEQPFAFLSHGHMTLH